MHILTGLYSPTIGTVRINGLDVNTNIEKIRESLGFVPQYNVLFEGMSVINHLWFYARLKGLSAEHTKSEMEKMLHDTGLDKKRHEIAKTLSGGMQRKLSVAIAFVGGARTVVLDEPSAGVDPKGRRDIWDLLFKYREGRTIVISTHHMDEADILGDRIAMIANGKLIAYATSNYLKTKFGRGYYLTISKKREGESKFILDKHSSCIDNSLKTKYSNIEEELLEIEEELFKTTIVDESINSFVKSRFRKAILIKNNISEMVYSIPNQVEFTSKYGEKFHEFESCLSSLRIDSIGLSDTSLEEIFIRLAKEPEPNKTSKSIFSYLKRSKMKYEKSDEDADLFKYTNKRVANKFELIFQQLYSLLIKRYHRVKRNVRGFLAEILLPVIFVTLALLVASLRPKVVNLPALELHPWLFSNQNYVFYRKYFDLKQENINLPIIENITNMLYGKPALGTRCMNNHKIEVVYRNDNFKDSTVVKVLQCDRNGHTIAKNSSLPINLENALTAVNYSYTKVAPSCMCATGFPKCPIGSEGDIDYRFVSHLVTTDTLLDLTQRNVTDWLLKTELSEKYFQKRYGGFDFSNDEGDTYSQINGIYSALSSIEKSKGKNKVKIWYNNHGLFAHVTFLNSLNNAILREKLKTQENVDPADIGIICINHPLPYTSAELSQERDESGENDIFVAICILFALSFIPASFLIFIVDERASNSKQLQFISGIKPYIYWIANFIWDLMNYIVPTVICIILFLLFDIKAYTSDSNFGPLICLMLLYGWAGKILI